MLQVRKLCSCGISAIIFQCCFIIGLNSSFQFFRVFFLGIISWKGASLFKGWGACFSVGLHFYVWEGHPMGDINFDGGLEKNHRMGPPCPPPLWDTLITGMKIVHGSAACCGFTFCTPWNST